MTETALATWTSRILRWALGLFLGWVAYSYEDAQILYLFAGVAFISGFFVPKRCVTEACETPAADKAQQGKTAELKDISFDEVTL